MELIYNRAWVCFSCLSTCFCFNMYVRILLLFVFCLDECACVLRPDVCACIFFVLRCLCMHFCLHEYVCVSVLICCMCISVLILSTCIFVVIYWYVYLFLRRYIHVCMLMNSNIEKS